MADAEIWCAAARSFSQWEKVRDEGILRKLDGQAVVRVRLDPRRQDMAAFGCVNLASPGGSGLIHLLEY